MAKTSVNEFLKSLTQLGDELRLQIENEVEGFAADEDARAERNRKTHDPVTGFKFFCKTYFPHYIDDTESVLHKH